MYVVVKHLLNYSKCTLEYIKHSIKFWDDQELFKNNLFYDVGLTALRSAQENLNIFN